MDPIEIENAGLVLAAPFLPYFFRNQGYLKGMRFTDEVSHARAIYLLQYMANEEYNAKGNLRLNALLCGWPDRQALPPAPMLNVAEKQQADQVLEAICSHWTALGDMGTETLRHRYLKRRGTLETGLESVLRVEPQPQDKLLRELPWVYAITQTPWSEKIAVHWDG